jgi:hypothetical protein
MVAGKQFWLGPARSGMTVTFWADPDVMHLLIAGASPKEVASRAGPTSVSLPPDRYGHLYPEADQALRDRLDALHRKATR